MKKKKPSLAEIVSRNIRKARLEAGMTQKELADKAGFKVSYIARLETKPQNLSLGVLERLGNALNITEIILLKKNSAPAIQNNDNKLLDEARVLIQRLIDRINHI